MLTGTAICWGFFIAPAISCFETVMRGQFHDTHNRKQIGGFPLGAHQAFAPIRLRNVPDCSEKHRSLGCPLSASAPEEGPSRIRGTFDRKQVNVFAHLLVPGGADRKCLFFGGSLSSASRPWLC